MRSKISRDEFMHFGLEQAKLIKHQGESYFRRHVNRLHATLKECEKLVSQSCSVLSLGAGSAFVETALAHFYGAKITVIEFEDAIRLNSELYNKFSIKTVSANISSSYELDGSYDIIMMCEIMEHLPIAPSLQMAPLVPYLKKDGTLIITTPNLRRIELIVDLIKGRPIMPVPKKFFSATEFENEAIHRREYLACEIKSELNLAGLGVAKIEYIWNEPKKNFFRLKRILYFPFELIFPFFRQIMIVVAKNATQQ